MRQLKNEILMKINSNLERLRELDPHLTCTLSLGEKELMSSEKDSLFYSIGNLTISLTLPSCYFKDE